MNAIFTQQTKALRLGRIVLAAFLLLICICPFRANANVQATTNDEPVAVWSISFTSSAVESWTYDGNYQYSYTQSGSTIVRKYADGTFDNTNTHINVVDDFEHHTGCGKTLHAHIAEPDRYDGNTTLKWDVWTFKDEDTGNWTAVLYYPESHMYPYAVNVHEYGSDCYGNTYDTTTTEQHREWENNCFRPILQGNPQGTEFTYHIDSIGSRDTYDLCDGPSHMYESNYLQSFQWHADVTVRLLVARDLTVSRLEVTQGLQDGANSIPLVKGRRTVVRAFLNIGTDPDPINGVTGVLEGYAEGVRLGAVSPFNTNEVINAPSKPDWKKIDDTLNFELPIDWTLQSSLHLTVKVNPYQQILEPNYDNNETSVDVSIIGCNGINIGYTAINYDPPGKDLTGPSANILEGQKFMQKIYPVSNTALIYKPLGPEFLFMNINDDKADMNLLKRLEVRLNLDNPPQTDHIYGWLPSLAYDDNGIAWINGAAAFGNDTEVPDRWLRTFAHEIGHNLGLYDNDDESLNTSGAHWFDVYDRVIKPAPAIVGGKTLLDFMVPGRLESEAWISPQNYRYLFNKLCSATTAAAEARLNLPQGSDHLIITGSIRNSDPVIGTLDPLLRISSGETTPVSDGMQYCIKLKDNAENLLSNYCFNQNFVKDSSTPADYGMFSMVVPYPTGLNRVELVQTASGTVLSSQVASAHPPSVTVTFPSMAGLTLSGNQTITWVGSDLDGNPLTYDVLYSRDNGTTWIGIGADITETSYIVDSSGLPGTQEMSGLIKVMVSDGFYTAQGTSTIPFAVDNKPPSAVILSPSSGASFTTGPKIVLEGSGVDLEDGSLGVSALSWVSSKDGALGAGQLREVNLSPGVHTITLTVTDSRGLISTDSIQITVVQSTSKYNLFLPVIKR